MEATIGICADCKKPNVPIYETLNKLVCDNCFQSPENQEMRVQVSRAQQDMARSIDQTITVRTDLFNAATASIVALKEAIDNDTSVTNKPYALATQLKDRFEHFKGIVFDLQNQLVEAGNQQKAIQIYLNTLANQLRQEEREKLRIQDINYKPNPVKTTKPAPVRTAKKFDKSELKAAAKELGVSEFTLQMLVVSKGITVEAAANILRRSIAESKSEAE